MNIEKKIDLRRIRIAREVLGFIPGAFARKMKILPIAEEAGVLTVLMADIADLDTIGKLENLTQLIVKPLQIENEEQLTLAVRRYYPNSYKGDGAEAMFDAIINRALQMKCSDIHLSPTKLGGLIKMRLDGRIHLEQELESSAMMELVSFIKVMAGLDISEKRIPLDGNISIDDDNQRINLRIATIPTLYGEHLTMRLLAGEMISGLDNLETLGMTSKHYELYSSALKNPNGIVLLSGPTGSGKTTTLYASLRKFALTGDRHIITIEDPVEMPLENVTQIKVDSDDDRVSFSKALKSILRHDPDIIMIGEIRDFETADIAVKSALTGHLVFSTLHTNSAAAILTRLINLGLNPFLVAATLNIAVAQRLVRRPCEYCMEWVKPDEKTQILIENCSLISPDKYNSLLIPKVNGCSFCSNTGYAGRTAIYEMLPVDENIKKMIIAGTSEMELLDEMVNAYKLPSLKDDGIAKVINGLTTFEEVEANCPFNLNLRGN
jgi:type IV pilus assembly protein PilB